jgi:serine/threonine-protein kinase RsbW
MSCRVHGSAAIREASDAARAFGIAQLLDDDELARFCIVIEELVANLYDHGGLSKDDQVELNFIVDPAGIRVAIVDSGVPFDPWTAPRIGEQNDRGGGVGIDIVRAWAHFLGYDSGAGQNRLEFLLPLRWNG